MRILIVAQHYWPSVGGAEVMLRRLAIQWTRDGHVVVVLAARWDSSWPMETLDEGVRVVRLPVTKLRFWGTIRYVRRVQCWLRRHGGDFDVVYVSMLKHAAYACLGSRGGRPIVLRPEGAGATGDVAWQQSALLGRRIQKRCRMATALVAPSRPIQTELIGAGYDATRIRFIPNGVPIPQEAWNSESASRHRRNLSLTDQTTLCFTGRLHEGKGVADLLRAVPMIRDVVGPINVLIVGDGPERANLERLSSATGIADAVRFTGAVVDVEPYLRASDLYVLPSYDEGMSVALLEAMALGVPAIASAIPANSELVDAKMLPLFPVRDPDRLAAAAIERIQNQKSALKWARSARETVMERFGIESVARCHIEFFRDLQAPTGTPANARA